MQVLDDSFNSILDRISSFREIASNFFRIEYFAWDKVEQCLYRGRN